MSEKITYGVGNIHYASKTESALGVPSYGSMKAWAGATELSLPPIGEKTPLYADNVVYYKAVSNQGYEGNLSVYQIPEDFKTNHIGEYKDANGVLIEKSTSIPLDFALLGEFLLGDDEADAVSTAKRFALYNCSAGRPDFASTTKQDTIEAVTMSVPITASPTISDEIIKATIKKEDNESLYNAWFDSVYYNPSDLALYTVTATITDGTNPVSGAVVVIGGKVATTNASGIARIALANGTYDVMVSATGYVAELSTVTVASEAEAVTVEIDEEA